MISIADLIQKHRGLVNELARYDYASVAPLVGGFLTFPNYHANTLRLDALAHLACYASVGKRKADREMLVNCAGRHFANSHLVSLEDPVEDAFVGNVATNFGNFRVFRGVEESGDFWTEAILRPFEEPYTPDPLKPTIRHIRALLALSEVVAERRQLKRYTFGSGQFCARLPIPQWRELIAASQAVTFSPSDLQSLEITLQDLVPFILAEERRGCLANQTTGHTDLERCPIIQCGDNLVLAAPHAVTLSVRRFMIEQLKQAGFLGFFEMFLHTGQFEKWLRTLHYGLGFEPVDIALPAPTEKLPLVYQTVMRFDEGKYAHVILLDGNIPGQLIDSHTTDGLTGEQQKELTKHLFNCAEILKGRPNFNGGMTLITRGGIGRGFAMSTDRIPEWGMIFASLPDWHTIARCDDMSALRLWRMWRHRQWAEHRGLKILNLSGTLNLYACWRSHNWRFIPRQMPMSQPHKLLSVGGDFVAGVRREVLHAYDDHSCLAHDGTHWIRVERRGARAYYANDRTAPVYVSPEAVGQQTLVGSIETANRIWWIASKTVGTTAAERSVLFQLWDCLLNWMNRAVSILEKEFSNLPASSVWVELDILDLSKWTDEDRMPEQCTSVLPTACINKNERKIVITLPPEFHEQFHVPQNQAERMLMDSVVSAIGKLGEISLSDNDRKRLLSAIFPNDAARYFHSVRTENWAQMLAGSARPSPDFVPEEEFSQSLIGLADEVGAVPSNGKITGDVECLKCLQKVVDKLWERIEKGLGQFNRQRVVTSCFTALAELEKDAEHWSMTARALLALQDQQEILRFAEERRSDRDAASLTNRLLVETAMYACPATGGRPLPNAERLELLAHLENLISAANHRDAISEGFMQAEIHVFPNGELDFDKRFYATVMSPYVRAMFAKGFRSSAKGYEQWFSNYQQPKNPDSEETLNRMEQPFREEFGLTLDQFVAIPHQLGRFALKNQKLMVEFDESGFRSFLMNECNLDAKSAEFYLARFSLPPRRAWDKDLDGYQAKDVWPWRFRRQLSLLMRPLVLLSIKPEKRWLVYPPLVHKSAAYIVGNIGEAAFPTEHFRTDAMRAFCGDQANRQGNQFTHEVADRTEQLGFVARREVAMSALGVPASAGDFGDVDVLAWKRDSTDVFVIECKCLRTAISVRDVVDRLDEYRGERDDSLGRHLRRLNWLKANPTAVSVLTGIPATAIRFKGLLVTDDLVPMQFFSGSAISPQDVVPLNQFASVLK
jgi:hypothetical protein